MAVSKGNPKNSPERVLEKRAPRRSNDASMPPRVPIFVLVAGALFAVVFAVATIFRVLPTPLYLLLGLSLATAVIAYWSDQLGMKLGKKRITLFGLRPRQTATLISIGSSWLIMLFSVAVLLLIYKPLKDALLRYDETKEDNKILIQQKQTLEQNIVEQQKNVQTRSRQNAALNRQIGQQNQSLQTLTAKIDARQADLTRARTGLQRSQNARDRAQAAQKIAQSGKRQAESARQEAESARQRAESGKNQAQQGEKEAQLRINQAQARFDQAQAKLTTATAQLQTAQSEVKRAQSEVERAQTEVERAQTEVRRAEGEVIRAQNEQRRAQKDLEKTQNTLTSTRSDLTNTRGDLTSTRSKLTDTQSDLTNAKKNLVKTRSELLNATEEKNQAESLKTLAVQELENVIKERVREQMQAQRDLSATQYDLAIANTLISDPTKIVVSAGHVFAAASLPANSNKVIARDFLNRLVEKGRQSVIQDGWKSLYMIPLPIGETKDEIVQALSNYISTFDVPVSVRLVAARSHIEGETEVVMRLLAYPVKQAFARGEVMAQTTIEVPTSGAAGDAQIFNKLLRLVDSGGKTEAQKRGIVPLITIETPNFFAPDTNLRIFEAMRQLQSLGAGQRANVKLIAADAISTVESPRVRFEIS